MHDHVEGPFQAQHPLEVLRRIELLGTAEREPAHDSARSWAELLAAYVEHLVERGQAHHGPGPGAFLPAGGLEGGQAGGGD